MAMTIHSRRPPRAGAAAALFALTASLLMTAPPLSATRPLQQPGGEEPPQDIAAAADRRATLPSIESVRVVGVRLLGEEAPERGPVQARIGDIILLDVRALKSLLDRSRCETVEGEPVPGCREQAISLFLEGREIVGLEPESGAPDVDEGTLRYHLARTRESDEAWADLLGAPRFSDFRYRPTSVSVGLAGDFALPSDVDGDAFELVRIKLWWGLAYVVLVLAFGVLVVRLARKGGVLRDRTAELVKEGKKGPYSLGRTQMAWWFFWVAAAFVGIWLITGATDTITGTTLALIGIGAGTALGASAIDEGKGQAAAAKRRERLNTLQNEVRDLNAAIAQNPTALDPTQDRLSEVKKELKASGTTKHVVSRGFFTDLLWDRSGLSFHRLQMVVWTVVLTILFIHSVYTRLSMPEFDATLLALMGISSGTYMGFKIPEQKTDAEAS